MDSYFPKTRRPITSLSKSSLKRPPPSITPPKAAKIPATPTTPKDARLIRPLQPPAVKRKLQLDGVRRRPMSVMELFKSAHPQEKPSSKKDTTTLGLGKLPVLTAGYCSPKKTTTTTTTTTTPTIKVTTIRTPTKTSPVKKRLFNAEETTEKALSTPIKITQAPDSPSKIASGPLKGVSTSLLDLIRAKEAAAKATTPEQERIRELLGIAPEIVRIVPTVFTASKKEVLPYDKVIDKCFKGLKSNYTSATITECVDFMDKVVPEWISTIQISRGKFMRINRDKYTIPQLLEAIRRYKKNC